MRKHKQGFIITPKGRVSMWVDIQRRTGDGFTFWVLNGAWAGRWWDSDDLLTNGGFTVKYESGYQARPSNFRYTPPSMPKFDITQYNEAIQWMQEYIDSDAR